MAGLRVSQAVHRHGGAVRAHGPGAAGQDRGEAPPVRREHRMADGEDAVMEPMEGPCAQSPCDGALADPMGEQLTPGHNPVLRADQLRKGTWNL
jgi:hypothetical protein